MYNQNVAIAKHKIKVLKKTNLIGKFWSIVFEKPLNFDYEAGQYVSILVSDRGDRRSYSLASFPRVNDLEIIFDIKPGGLGSNFLVNLEVGDEVEILGPMGRFVVGSGGLNSQRKMLFVGTGTGIAPLRSMINDLLANQDFGGNVVLHWGMRSEDEIFMVKELEDLRLKFSNFSYDLVLSQAGTEWQNCRGHVQDCLVGHEQNWLEWEAYLCGNQKMVIDVAALLVTKGMKKEKIYFEKFY